MKSSTAVVGTGTGMNGQEAAMQAAQQALDQMGTSRPVLALAFVSQEFSLGEALAGLAALLGDTPFFGFSTTRPLTAEGDQPRSVTVALLTGADLRAHVLWFPTYAQESAATARQLAQALNAEVFLPQHLLIAADGITGSLAPVCDALAGLLIGVSGGMAAGDPSLGKTFILGRNQAGAGALAAVLLGGEFRVGVGLGHGWRGVGVHLRATRSRDVWLQALDDRPAAEAYARWFGFPARDWAFPPLSEMARLYPLGVEAAIPAEDSAGPDPAADAVEDTAAPFLQPAATDLLAPVEQDTGWRPAEGRRAEGRLLLRSALRVEVDGSLRLSAPVPEGAVVHLMTGDPDGCLEAARAAARQALAALGSARPDASIRPDAYIRPLLAVALVDAAWAMLLENRPGELSAALMDALGDVPLVGAYTFGQLVRPALNAAPVLHNGNIEVIVFGEEEE